MEGEQLKRLEDGILQFIAERRNALGIEESGLHAYYAQRVDKARALTRYERELLDHLSGDPHVFHAGIGIGPLTAGLALQGSSVVGFESDQRRFRAAMALRERVAPGAIYEIRPTVFPDGLRPTDDAASATLLFTNVASSWPEDVYESTIGVMPRFRRTILDLRLFGHTRDEEDHRRQLQARFEAAGLIVRHLPFRSANNYYVELTPIK